MRRIIPVLACYQSPSGARCPPDCQQRVGDDAVGDQVNVEVGERDEDQARPRPQAVVLVRVDDHEFGLVVDGMQSGADQFRCRDLLDAASLSTIVVKPIGGLLAGLGLYSGATVLGDGGVVLFLPPAAAADVREALATAGVEFLPPSQWIAPAPEYGLKIHEYFRS